MGQEARSCRYWAKTPGSAGRSPGAEHLGPAGERQGGSGGAGFWICSEGGTGFAAMVWDARGREDRAEVWPGAGEPVALYMGAGVGVGIDPGISLAGCRQIDRHKDYV